MDTPVEISLKQARYLALRSQGLTSKTPFGRGHRGVVNALKRIGYSQIDTISVVERAHHHVLWSRVPDYSSGDKNNPSTLDQLMNKPDGVFEYWSHAAAFLPMADYRYSLIRKHRLRSGANIWFKRDDDIVQNVLKRITEEGPLSSLDFKHPNDKKQNGWWSWKPAKKALEQLFLDGTLMIRKRQGFRKVFDLTERVLPEDTNNTIPTMDEYSEWLIRKMLRAHGIATLIEICHWSSRLKPVIKSSLDKLVETGEVLTCKIAAEPTQEYYILPQVYDGMTSPGYTSEIRIINPFDNAVIQRKRIERLFGFKYQFECYVPAEKRQFGYFSLLLLWRDKFIGLVDCKAHRKTAHLEVKSVHYLHNKPMPDFRDRLQKSLDQFSEWMSLETNAA